MNKAYSHWHCERDYQVVDFDEATCLLFITGNHRVFRISSSLGERLRDSVDAMTPGELEEWNLLATSGLLSEVNPIRSDESSFRDGANLAININLTAYCNLNCTYCFADGGDYGRITGRMETDSVSPIFDFIKDNVTPSQTVRFEFFGGEPLLNVDRIEEICRRAEQVEQECDIRFLHRISTNLTVLPETAVLLFAEKHFVVSVSIDGGQETHNQNRPTKGGGGSFDTILENCKVVRRASEDILMVARMTVVGGGKSLLENVRELWELNLFDYFQIYPGVVSEEKQEAIQALPLSLNLLPDSDTTFGMNCGGSSSSVGAQTMYSGFLKEQAEFAQNYSSFFTSNNRFRGVLEYEEIADMLVRGKMALSFCSGGRNYFTFSPDDSVMPCHRLVGETQFRVADPDVKTENPEVANWRLPIDTNPTCSQCWVRYICAGGCKQENLVATGDLNDPNLEGCDYQRQLVSGMISNVAKLGVDYRQRSRHVLADMFVSCGRPTMMNGRSEDTSVLSSMQHFHEFEDV